MSEQADVVLLPGETSATAEPADVTHWVEVYTELVTFCHSVGITHNRFEQRLAHWQRQLGTGHCAATNGNGHGPAGDGPS